MKQEIPEFPNFRKKEFLENFCFIRFWTGICGNFGRMERALFLVSFPFPAFLARWRFFPLPRPRPRNLSIKSSTKEVSAEERDASLRANAHKYQSARSPYQVPYFDPILLPETRVATARVSGRNARRLAIFCSYHLIFLSRILHIKRSRSVTVGEMVQIWRSLDIYSHSTTSN